MSVDGVRIERDVADDTELGQCILECTRRATSEAVAGQRGDAIVSLEGCLDTWEDGDGLYPEGEGLPSGRDRPVDGPDVHTRHRPQLGFDIRAFDDEERPDQVPHFDRGFSA